MASYAPFFGVKTFYLLRHHKFIAIATYHSTHLFIKSEFVTYAVCYLAI